MRSGLLLSLLFLSQSTGHAETTVVDQERLFRPLSGATEFTYCFNLYFNAEVQYNGRSNGQEDAQLLGDQRRKALRLAAENEADADLSSSDKVEHILCSSTSREFDHAQRRNLSNERVRDSFVDPRIGYYAEDLKRCDDLLERFD